MAPAPSSPHSRRMIHVSAASSSAVHSSTRLFLDSACRDAFRAYLPAGTFYGVTTNPLILERDQGKCTLEYVSNLRDELAMMPCEELQVQAWGETAKDMHECGLRLADLATDGIRIVVKVPATRQGFEACRLLIHDGVPVTVTAVYNPQQVLAALAVGAEYAAPYLGRMNDAGRDGFGNIVDMQSIVESSDGDTRILVASLRSARELASLAAEGCGTFTFSPAVAEELFTDPLTMTASADFEAAAKRIGG